MTYTAFILAVLALLLSPGPTNTLMGLYGTQKGIQGVIRLIPAEILGYLTTILPLVWLGSQVPERWPAVALVMKIAAAAWVMFLATRLWQPRTNSSTLHEVTARQIYVTTTLNPKALIFALVLLPPLAAPEFAARLAGFVVMVVGAALLWGGAGRIIQTGSSGGRRLRVIQRLASGWLGLISITMIVSLIRA
jgi:threonine/homoserine/homoserine lactone efflux protein